MQTVPAAVEAVPPAANYQQHNRELPVSLDPGYLVLAE